MPFACGGALLAQVGFLEKLEKLRRLAVQRRDIDRQHPRDRARPVQRPHRRGQRVADLAAARARLDQRHRVGGLPENRSAVPSSRATEKLRPRS